ncbi:hypothetical protein BO70DRAFT_357428 [Aspergillus heteromorphus CBS 117.55]|uniref:Uncharacterized protein n=1 Tax=Aspergillus heteromorphus CBS 117.55 TaxID=1448321 RepID=A0A317X6V8_9EURO|nr:uncharacterized protein BO70DRAFT_357428 [Aspergillus heteromorphus CBS 117.55]PWY92310.1 hypothetical protein BO70DRAFT_357428 [Aspergillus heteromorphus CBS 117.55]
MSTRWEVTSFSVQTSTADGRSDALYANGRMQVPVIVVIRAVTEGTFSPYQLTTAELQRILLVDYHNTASEITGDWFYSRIENEFAHTLTGGRDPAQPILEPGAQAVFLWVSTTRIANRNIGARITQPNGTIITTNSSSFNSQVTLTGMTPLSYNTNNVSIRREDTEEGTWRFDIVSSGTVVSSSANRWDQDNYYITLDNHQVLLKADVYGYDATGSQNGVHSDPRLANSFAYYSEANMNLSIFYFWPVGPEATKAVGAYRELNWTSSYKFVANAFASIRVNQTRNALCLTRMLFVGGSNALWGQEWSMDTWFRLYDQFGNSGDFAPVIHSKNTLSLENRNMRSEGARSEAKL